MGSPSKARFSLRHPEDGPKNTLDMKAKVAAREQYASECASRVVSTRESRRPSPAFAADARNPSFYSPLAREIAAISEPEERAERIRSLGFFALPVHVEVDLLRMCMRLGVDVGESSDVSDEVDATSPDPEVPATDSRPFAAETPAADTTPAEANPSITSSTIASVIDSSLQSMMPPPLPDDDDSEETGPAPIAFA